MLIDGQIGWRGLSYLAGGVSIALALLVLVVLPPLPPAAETETKAVSAESELVAAESGEGGAAVAPPAATGLGVPL